MFNFSLKVSLYFLMFETFLISLGWYGKVEIEPMYISIALLVHLIASFLIFLNLAPVLGAAFIGAIGGYLPQTQNTGGSGASSTVKWYVRASMGLSFATTCILLSLFLFDYQYDVGNFVLAIILVLIIGQWSLVFDTESIWAKRLSGALIGILALVTLLCAINPTLSVALIGKPLSLGFHSNQVVAKGDHAMQRNTEDLVLEKTSRVEDVINQYNITSINELKKMETGFISMSKLKKGDIDAYEKKQLENKNGSVLGIWEKTRQGFERSASNGTSSSAILWSIGIGIAVLATLLFLSIPKTIASVIALIVGGVIFMSMNNGGVGSFGWFASKQQVEYVHYRDFVLPLAGVQKPVKVGTLPIGRYLMIAKRTVIHREGGGTFEETTHCGFEKTVRGQRHFFYPQYNAYQAIFSIPGVVDSFGFCEEAYFEVKTRGVNLLAMYNYQKNSIHPPYVRLPNSGRGHRGGTKFVIKKAKT